MGGFVTAAITIFVIFIFGKVMAAKPDDDAKQDAWHRFKRKFRAGRIYHLFAARTKQRLFGVMFIYYLMAGGCLLVGVDMLISTIHRSYIPLAQMAKMQGKLLQFIQTGKGCGKVSIQSNQEIFNYSICYENDEYIGLSKMIGKPVTVWVTQESTLFNGSSSAVKQLQNQQDVVVKDRVDSKENFDRTQRTLWYLVFFFFTFSIAGIWGAARRNILEYGPWQGYK